MAKTKISEFSATPANNTDIDNINIAEGCAPSGINDAIRELMSQLKDFQTGAVGDSFNGPVGTTTAAAGAFTTLTTSSTVTLNGGTANGVPYLNGSKVLTSGSALTFDGTKLNAASSADGPVSLFGVSNATTGGNATLNIAAGSTQYAFPSARGDAVLRAESNSLVFGTASEFKWGSASAEWMRLTSTGLGIGTSSMLGVSDRLAVVGGNIAVQRTSGITTILGDNTQRGYVGTISNHALSFLTNSTEQMFLNSSGNLGLGVTPSAWGAGFKAFDIGSAGALFTGGAGQPVVSYNSYYNGGDKYKTSAYASAYEQFNGQHRWYVAPVGTAGNAISFTQAMTLDASGNLLVGLTSSLYNGVICTSGNITVGGNQLNFDNGNSTIEFVNRNSAGSKTFSWYYQASAAGSPATLSTSGVWTNASDARGKENISDIHYGLDTVMALQPRQYDVKSDGSHAIGFVAQEVLPVVPELVHVTRRTENDEFYGLDYGSMTAVLVKAIQEQQAIIDQLKARLDAANI